MCIQDWNTKHFIFFFSHSKQGLLWAAVSICIQFLQIQHRGNNSNWIEKSTMFHSVTVLTIARNIHICALTFSIPVQVCCSFHCYLFCPGLNFRIIIHTHRKCFLWRKSLWRGIAEWIQAIFQISVQSYMHTNGEKITWLDISVKGEWREKRKPRGQKGKGGGRKNLVCTCVSIYCHCCNKIHIWCGVKLMQNNTNLNPCSQLLTIDGIVSCIRNLQQAHTVHDTSCSCKNLTALQLRRMHLHVQSVTNSNQHFKTDLSSLLLPHKWSCCL